jgi:hypothetical protein
MPVNVTATLRKVVRELQAERAQIGRQLGALRDPLSSLDGARSASARAARSSGASRRRRMSAAARRALSQRMRAYWAKRKAASKVNSK